VIVFEAEHMMLDFAGDFLVGFNAGAAAAGDEKRDVVGRIGEEGMDVPADKKTDAVAIWHWAFWRPLATIWLGGGI